MTDSYVGVTEASTPTGKLDAESLTVGANTVKRERVQIAGATATQIAPVSATDGLTVNLGSNNDVTVTSGTVDLGATDNAVLDAIAAALAIMDDWDESDRAKVNLIVGQAGIAAGAGSVGATVPRVTLASDAPEPVEPADWITATVGGASVLAAAGDYAANDVLSNLAGAGLGAAWQFANAARASGGRGWIAHVSVYTAIAAFIPRIRVWFFSDNPTASELDDNSAFTIHADDLGKLIDYVDLPSMANIGGGSFSSNADVRLRFELAATTLYAIVQALDAETDETAGMTFVLKAHVVQD